MDSRISGLSRNLSIFGRAFVVLAVIVGLLATTRATEGDAAILILLSVYVAGSVVAGVVAYLNLPRTLGLAMFALTNLFWFGWPGLNGALGLHRYWGDFARYRLPVAVVVETAFAMVVFLILGLAGYALARVGTRRAPVAPDGAPPEPVSFTSTRVLGGLFLLGVLPYLVLGGGITEIISGIMQARSASKPWSMGAHLVNDAGPLVIIGRATLVTFCSAAFWLWIFRRELAVSRRWSWFWLGAALFGLMVTFLDTGTRTWTLMIVGPGMLAVPLRARASGRGRQAIVAVVVVLASLVAAQLQRAYRYVGGFQDLDEEDVTKVSDNDFFTETAIAMDLVPRKFDYIGQVDVTLFVSHMVPRSIWPSKPISEAIRLFTIGRDRKDAYVKTGLSRLPSIVGQQWMNFGWAGVMVMSLLYGLSFGAFERLIKPERMASFSSFTGIIGLVWLFSAARMLIPGFHYPVLISLLIVWFSWWRAAARPKPVSVTNPLLATRR